MTQTPQEQHAALMEKVAVYCNAVTWNTSQLGLRLTFGELPTMEGEATTHRLAVFLPLPLVKHVIEGLAKSWAAQEAKNKAMVESQGQSKQ